MHELLYQEGSKGAHIDHERQQWNTHVLSAPYAHVPIETITRKAIREHLEGKLAGGETISVVHPALRLMRATFRRAVEED